jgi:hypothetical protein
MKTWVWVEKIEELPDVIQRRKGMEVVDLQTPLEWADNNHPLWEPERTVCRGRIPSFSQFFIFKFTVFKYQYSNYIYYRFIQNYVTEGQIFLRSHLRILKTNAVLALLIRSWIRNFLLVN